jgi:hypothetical protein
VSPAHLQLFFPQSMSDKERFPSFPSFCFSYLGRRVGADSPLVEVVAEGPAFVCLVEGDFGAAVAVVDLGRLRAVVVEREVVGELLLRAHRQVQLLERKMFVPYKLPPQNRPLQQSDLIVEGAGERPKQLRMFHAWKKREKTLQVFHYIFSSRKEERKKVKPPFAITPAG